MKAKLKTAIVYLGLCSTLFSCVPNEADFYEKEFPEELEGLDTRSRNQQEQQDQQSGDSINEEIILSAIEPAPESSSTSTVVVYTDVEGTPVEINEDDLINIDDNTGNETTDIIVEDGPGDDEIPGELSGNNDSSNDSGSDGTEGSSANNDGDNSTTESTTDSADSTDSDSESNTDSEVTDASNDNTNQATEGETSSNDSSSDAEGNVSTEEGTSDETGNDSVSENTSGNENGGTSNEGSSNEGSDDSTSDETASNESGGTEGESGSSGDDEQNTNDQTADNGDQSTGSEGSSSTESDSDSNVEETADNGNGDDSTTGESDSQDNTDNSSEVTDNGGGGDESSGSDSENGDNSTDEEVTDNQEQSENDETTGGDTITDNGSGSTGESDNSETSETNDGEGSESEEEDQPVIVVTEEDEEFVNEVENAVDNDEYICNPFEGDEHSTSFQGIAGFVYDGLSHPYNDVHDYYLFGQKSSTPIFMPEINTPTRKFDKGFELNNGSFVENAFGGKLFEYFALDLRGQIRLGELEEEGHYQFAVISDDGSIFEIDKDGELKEHVNNNQLTPTRMKCASSAIHFTHETKKKFRLKYFQGPRMHIALMLMWRKVDPENIPHEKYCNKGGNGLFFDFNQTPSEPKAKYKELLARGWKPLDSQNFLLPEGLRENPCGNDQPQAETQCLSEEVVLDGRNWFHFDGDDVDMSSLKITDEKDRQRSHHYVGPQKRIRIGGRCLRGHKFKVSYCTK